LQKYQWWILGGLAAGLVIGGVYVASRQQAATRGGTRSKVRAAVPIADLDDEPEEATPVSSANLGRPRATSSMLLEGLKEELFQLEVEHKQGRISNSEYQQAKSALDQTLQLALKRAGQKV
jgi:hypothetical protein